MVRSKLKVSLQTVRGISDLQEITEIVEEVKKGKTEEIELLKAELAILSNRKLQIFSEEKEAIVVFFAQLNSWLWDSLNIRLNEFNHTNYKDLSERVIKMRDSYNQTQVAFSKVQLLVDDKDLTRAGHEVIRDVQILQHFIEELSLSLHRNLAWDKSTVELVISEKFDFQKLSQEMKNFYLSESIKGKEERQSIWKEYLDGHKAPFDVAILKLHEFKERAKAYLRN